DGWLEAIVLLTRFGLPAGPHAAVIAPAGSWLEAQALAVVAEAETAGARPPTVGDPDDPTDAVLFDPALGTPPASVAGLHVPGIARGERARDEPALWGARAALAAVAMLGRAAQRIAAGLGPADASASAELAVDHQRVRRQLDKLARHTGRIGDHTTKVLLAAYGVPITRQAAATTPAAAVKLARRAGYPVDIRPWGDDVPSERAGGAIEPNVTSDALVRRAFMTVNAGRTGPDAAVIVRETPPPGREISASFVRLALGCAGVLGGPGPPQGAAGPAPRRALRPQARAGL